MKQTFIGHDSDILRFVRDTDGDMIKKWGSALNYSELFHLFYRKRRTGGLKGLTSKVKIVEFFFKTTMDDASSEMLPTSDSGFDKWFDMLAGPSEILIVADETADPVYAAADMLSQAEHDPLASSILITTSVALAAAVAAEVEKQLAVLPRKAIAGASIEKNGLIVVAEDMDQAIAFANASAPEHLELLTARPFELLPSIRHAGAVFLGAYSPEPLGDYFAGPDHILPTGGTARFYSVLNVETFMKRTSFISYTQSALADVSEDIIRLAKTEGLDGHANAIRLRGEGA